MTSITTLLKKILMLDCNLLTQTVLIMKLNQKMFMKNTNTCLTFVNIINQNFLIQLTTKLLPK